MHQNNFHTFIGIAQWPVVVFGLHVIASISGAYWYIDKLDNVLHFLGGASIGAATVAVFHAAQQYKYIGNIHWLFKLFLTVSVVALAAVCWEFFEYFIDTVLGGNMQGDIVDTMSDLALGLTGGTLVALTTTLRNRK